MTVSFGGSVFRQVRGEGLSAFAVFKVPLAQNKIPKRHILGRHILVSFTVLSF